jgi:hypothetical protein
LASFIKVIIIGAAVLFAIIIELIRDVAIGY